MNIGVLGGGQLGRMMALAAYPLGLRLRFMDRVADGPAGQVAKCIAGDFNDPEALKHFAEDLDLVTYEFENIPAVAAHFLGQHVPRFLPPPHALELAQDRLAQKNFFERLGVPVPPFQPVSSRAGLDEGIEFIGLPAVLKTRRWGYDGKGQSVLRKSTSLDEVWEGMGGSPLILEGFVNFERELSLIAAQGSTGETAFYPLTENRHREGILRSSLAPAPDVPEHVQKLAEDYASRVLRELRYTGVLTLEFFYVGGKLLTNEMATRVHNSGHWTIEGADTSQFENHLRAVAGLPLGSTAPRGHAAMVNFIGRAPDPAALLAIPGVHLHLYGKAARPGRKLGHATLCTLEPCALADSLQKLEALAAS